MNAIRLCNTFLVAAAFAATVACGDSRSDTGAGAAGEAGAAPDRGAAPTDAARHERGTTPITVAGCLQKGDGSAFILTRVNQPTQSVGTSGAVGAARGAGSGAKDVVESEQMRSAAGAYRVDAMGDMKLDDLVGKQVQVVGTVAQDMDLPRANAGGNERPEIREGDLTRIDATSVTTLADMCRGAESPAGRDRSAAPPSTAR
jgi:hypothetical protein